MTNPHHSATRPEWTEWPYPFWVAHRGAGKLAPENTMAAFRHGAHFGYRMFECDAKLSRDGVLFLMHDTELARTTNGEGIAAEQDWGTLAQLDAGSWHSRRWAGEPLPTLRNLLHWCIRNHYAINIEIKPSPGAESETGRAVAELVAQIWPDTLPPPLLSSFKPQALAAARQAVPAQTRALLMDEWSDGSLALAGELGCAALVCNQLLWTPERVQQCHGRLLRALSYTVNEAEHAQRLKDLGTDGIITDRIDLFSPIGTTHAPL
ncbi:glycerophosphodiester phosphodiesterase [Corticibacter populi]|uniref:Glycerophosphodiester phosphodiesterase n=1 Tax=Corticibacter populi TaxID=1550736 RepID=A0A3M6QYH2_9BURK|nr:glycerophosphodiester phosphodiesterase [Corticibacter populi]RMX08038.1 glycerophosphodiester phosphodiesterase [Corticibacter populi]RZS35283.1 glycerophosphoryl diester phosphodiesterase [Corticibacter populi]